MRISNWHCLMRCVAVCVGETVMVVMRLLLFLPRTQLLRAVLRQWLVLWLCSRDSSALGRWGRLGSGCQ